MLKIFDYFKFTFYIQSYVGHVKYSIVWSIFFQYRYLNKTFRVNILAYLVLMNYLIAIANSTKILIFYRNEIYTQNSSLLAIQIPKNIRSGVNPGYAKKPFQI